MIICMCDAFGERAIQASYEKLSPEERTGHVKDVVNLILKDITGRGTDEKFTGPDRNCGKCVLHFYAAVTNLQKNNPGCSLPATDSPLPLAA